MDLLSARQRLVSANIANADTPGYLTQDLDFDREMRNASGGPPRAMDAPGLTLKNDGNNVSLDREARLLAENALRLQVASGLMHTQIQIVKSAIDGGQNA
jgi:flagellar basal-body rod protein FlgB